MKKVRGFSLLCAGGLLFCAAFLGCAKKSATVALSQMPKAAFREMAVADEAEVADFSNAESGGVLPERERKLIKNGYVSIEVESLRAARETAENWVKAFGGFIKDSDEYASHLSITARIPAARFDEAMKATGDFGKTLSRNISTNDVTEQFYDLESRLAAKEIMVDRLNFYLSSAKDIKDMIEIETKLNEVTSDLDSMRSRMKRLSGDIDFSTISISAALPVNRTEDGFTLPDAKTKMREFTRNVLEFFVSLAFFVLYAVVFGIPIILIIALAFWLLFGKIGIIRRLYAKLKN